jgi:hypothetical protein
MTTYFMAFFKYDDSTTWQRTSLFLEKKTLEEYIKTVTYVDQSTVNIKEIELPS